MVGPSVIKATGTGKSGTPVLLIGLSHENLARLVADEPIAFDAEELGLPALRVLLMAAPTEQDLIAAINCHNGHNGQADAL